MDVIGRVLATGEMVLREVGRGALAHVYLVSDGVAVRALKLLPEGREDRADHEYRVAHGLDHPCVGHVDARLEVEGRPGLLLPFVAGRRLLARGPTHADRLAYLAAFGDLLDALAYLRLRGVVHRDVKPENVLVDRAGRARLIDFDLALRVDERERAPKAAGTLAYLSPEQELGAPATYAADLYAAGVLLHTALTGEAPVGPDDRARPSLLDPSLTAADELVLDLLVADPERRVAASALARPRLDALVAEWQGAGAS